MGNQSKNVSRHFGEWTLDDESLCLLVPLVLWTLMASAHLVHYQDARYKLGLYELRFEIGYIRICSVHGRLLAGNEFDDVAKSVGEQ